MLIRPGTGLKNSNDPKENVGTLGGVVVSDDGQSLLLTCFHCVYHNPPVKWTHRQPVEGCGRMGFYIDGRFTPNLCDLYHTYRDNKLDIALIKPSPQIDMEPSIPIFGRTNGICYLGAEDSGRVWLRKYGAVTKDTYGRFEGFAPPIGVLYNDESKMHFLHDLMIVRSYDGTPFCRKGDSGAFVMDAQNRVAGVLVMTAGDTGYVMQASHIESRLNIKFKI